MALHGRMASEAEWLRGLVVTVAGNPASEHDINQFVTVTLLRYGLEADLLGKSSLEECVHRRCVHAQKAVDLCDYASDFKLLKMKFIEAAQATEQLCSFGTFKRSLAPEIRNQWILGTLGQLWSLGFAAVLQWLSFDERLLLNTNEADRVSEVLDYLEFENCLSLRTYPDDTCRILCDILSDWFCDFSLGEYEPSGSFGPGAVADVRSVEGRVPNAIRRVYEGSGPDPDVVRLFSELYDIDEDEVLPSGFCCDRFDPVRSYTNKIIFVPKNALKHRIISSEPAWLTWLQHDLAYHLYEKVNGDRRIHTDFTNQVKSRELALEGSRNGRYATYDFSNASDSVTVELVRRLYAKTYFIEALLAARSRFCRIGTEKWSEIVSLDKFAPMGSVTCFVTMDLILCAVCEQAVRATCGRPSREEDYVVYGDDVIIDVAFSEQFLRLVEEIGFILNRDKSYDCPTSPHFYRESCGIEAFDGVDVTPIRISRHAEPIYRSGGEGPLVSTELDSITDFANRLLLKGFWNTRSVALWMLKNTLRSSTPRERHIWDTLMRIDMSDYVAGSVGPSCVVVPDGTATNYRTQRRWNSALQRREYKVSAFVTKLARKETYEHEGTPLPSGMTLDDALYDLWFFLSRTTLPSNSTHVRLSSQALGMSSQQWRDIWAP